MNKPEYTFEVSWEVCNKIGGIHTVISTKALSMVKRFEDRYITIGPDVWRESQEHPEFREEPELYRKWREKAVRDGIRVRVGRWKIAGNPVAIVLDFTTLFTQKNDIFKSLWETYRLDSISGQWDYVEPALFGYAAGKAVEHFVRYHALEDQPIVSQFHEWQTGAGLLYLEQHQPSIATVFTTHATTVGRSMAGNNQSLYSQIEKLNGDLKARELNVVSKHSLEKLAAQNADTFTTVSELTASECRQIHEREVDVVVPNGFEDSFVPLEDYQKRRHAARTKMLEVASALSGEDLKEDTLLIATSGRYEFRNKGIDLLIDSLGELNRQKKCEKQVVAFFLIPANHYGARKDLLDRIGGSGKGEMEEKYLTHNLHYAEHDIILNRFRENGLHNMTGSVVKVVFVPSYLNGHDGIFDLPYYDVLIGLDMTVFPSYYEPWGYTPLESLAFSIPTVTTTLTGFGRWVNKEFKEEPVPGIRVIPRDDFNDKEVVKGIGQAIMHHCGLDEKGRGEVNKGAYRISRIALWESLINHYWQAYDHALASASGKEIFIYEKERVEQLPEAELALVDIRPTWHRVMVQQRIPEQLKTLEEMSRNLWWSWTQDAIDLFGSIDEVLWEEVGENPVELLERLPYDTLKRLEKSDDFTRKLEEVYGAFKAYMEEKPREDVPSVSYFSMEYGIHNSLKTFSGGLGLLAGDFLKEASDYNIPLAGVGLLYRYGYFRQVISAGGEQVAVNDSQDFSRLPVIPVRDENGNWKNIQIVLPGRTLSARIWKVQVGRVPLYLLDTDYEANQQEDREISHSLYGGDNENRLKQEILLGIGGIRALRKIGLDTDLYHCNEGHAAFTGLERLRELIQEKKMTFPEALEVVRGSSLFTTHTPVPAGHDSFDEDLLRTYLAHYPERLQISWNYFMNLGRYHLNAKEEKFSMSVLAVKLSQEVNGVSRIHGRVSREMFAGMWPGYMNEELHIGYVTNGVHLPTWLGSGWKKLYEKAFGSDCYRRQEDRLMWDRIKLVPDDEIWDLKCEEREKLVNYIRERLTTASIRMMDNPGQMLEIANNIDKDTLTIGFARRFATYKRAHLLFRDLERLAKIVNDPERPVQFIFAGKAHPRDIPGQDLIKMIVGISKQPEFMGKIIFLQNYDIQLAKKLYRGVDIWLNTPTRPLEASGTSGEKCVMNGTMHFSVLDGWWAEGYRQDAGWALPIEQTFDDQELQDELDAERIYSLLENNITQKFYQRSGDGIPEDWIGMIRNTIAHVAPEFTMNRMLRDYIKRFYLKLQKRTLDLKEHDYQLPKELSRWKHRVMSHWKNIQVLDQHFPDATSGEFMVGETYTGKVLLELDGLDPDEIGVEMVFTRSESGREHSSYRGTLEFECTRVDGTKAEYTFVQDVDEAGVFDIGFRIFPKNEHIPHRMDFPLVRWI